jgi:23S rRNA (adenine2030-N6)-methyltransferase
MRPIDRLIACELKQQTYQALRAAFLGDKQAAVHHLDGFLGLKAFLPPAERRAITLIDPPYENPDELIHIAYYLNNALRRFASGTYAIWYPIKERRQITHFHQVLKQTVTQPILIVELTIYPDLPQHLNGSGAVIVNPPWQVDKALLEILPWLWKALTINDQGDYCAYFLK